MAATTRTARRSFRSARVRLHSSSIAMARPPIGRWGSDVTMTPNVVSVRQNLNLLVDGGQPVPGLNAADTTQWGNTLGNAIYVWRSGIGVTSDGALVYVGGPGLNITDLANLLVRAGAVRAMELDINTDWVNFSVYKPATPTGAASGLNGTELLPGMTGTPARYFQTWWARDFFTMSAAVGYLTCAPTIEWQGTIPSTTAVPHPVVLGTGGSSHPKDRRWVLGDGPRRSEKLAAPPVDQECPGLRGSGSGRSHRSPD